MRRSDALPNGRGSWHLSIILCSQHSCDMILRPPPSARPWGVLPVRLHYVNITYHTLPHNQCSSLNRIVLSLQPSLNLTALFTHVMLYVHWSSLLLTWPFELKPLLWLCFFCHLPPNLLNPPRSPILMRRKREATHIEGWCWQRFLSFLVGNLHSHSLLVKPTPLHHLALVQLNPYLFLFRVSWMYLEDKRPV